MAIQGDLVGQYLVGQDVLISECGVVLTQPTIKEILQLGEDNFFEVINFMAQIDKMLQEIQREDVEMQMVSELQLFLLIYRQEPHMRTQVRSFFELVFPKYQVICTENSIDFKQLDEEKDKMIVKGRVNPFNFENLKTTIVNLFLPYSSKKEDYNPGTNKAEEIAKKLREGREKVAQQKNEDGDISLLGTYISILSVGMNMDINIFLDYTPFQLFDTFMRYNAKVAQDRYFAISTIPFADTSKLEAPDEWTSNLYN